MQPSIKLDRLNEVSCDIVNVVCIYNKFVIRVLIIYIKLIINHISRKFIRVFENKLRTLKVIFSNNIKVI